MAKMGKAQEKQIRAFIREGAALIVKMGERARYLTAEHYADAIALMGKCAMAEVKKAGFMDARSIAEYEGALKQIVKQAREVENARKQTGGKP